MMDKTTRKAEQELAEGRLDLAAARFEKQLRQAPGHLPSLLGMARIALATDAYEEAAHFAQEALKQSPEQPDAQVFLALSREARGDFQQALSDICAVAERAPECFYAVFHAARLLAAQGEDLPLAETYAQRACALKPGDYDVLHLLGLIEQRLGKLGEAIEAFREAARITPKRLEAYLSLADTLLMVEEPLQAERVLEEAIRLVGPDPLIWQKQAGVLLFKGDVKGALRCAQKVCDKLPNSVTAHLNLGQLLLLDRQVEAAERTLLKAQTLAPKLAEPPFELGVLYEGVGLEEQAMDCYRRALELDPEMWRAANNLGLLLLGSEDPAAHVEAERYFREAVAHTRGEVFAPLFNLALALVKQGQHEEAQRLCADLLAQELPEENRQEVMRLQAEIR